MLNKFSIIINSRFMFGMGYIRWVCLILIAFSVQCLYQSDTFALACYISLSLHLHIGSRVFFLVGSISSHVASLAVRLRVQSPVHSKFHLYPTMASHWHLTPPLNHELASPDPCRFLAAEYVAWGDWRRPGERDGWFDAVWQYARVSLFLIGCGQLIQCQAAMSRTRGQTSAMQE